MTDQTKIQSADDLKAVILELGRTEPDPGVVTEKILSSLKHAEAHVVAQVTLRDYVRHILSRPPVAAQTRTYETRGGQKTVSAALAGIIDWYEAELSRSVFVSDTWKRLADCTRSDVDKLASARKRKAADLIAEAEKYEALAQAMDESGADTVADLDPEVGREVLRK